LLAVGLGSCECSGWERRVKCEGVFCFDMPPGGGREIVSKKRKITEKGEIAD